MRVLLHPVEALAPAPLDHGGHGVSTASSVFHYLTEPEHLMIGALIVLTASFGVWQWLRRRSRATSWP